LSCLRQTLRNFVFQEEALVQVLHSLQKPLGNDEILQFLKVVKEVVGRGGEEVLEAFEISGVGEMVRELENHRWDS
jgi:dephospho-CoA kinase